MPYEIVLIDRLADDEAAMAFMTAAHQEGETLGYWPKRAAPTGEEQCVILRFAPTGRIDAGATFFAIEGERHWIDLVFVTMNARRNGIGRAVMRRVREACDDQATKGIMFGSMLNNNAMHNLGRTCGFEPDHMVFATPGCPA